MDRAILFTIIVAALGYFVDIFDLLLFSIVRVPSLKSLGVADGALLSTGIVLINVQMIGLLLGGILWGVLGDRMGRKSVLFGSILLYSIANISNGFAHGVKAYAALRFIAGIGLAGELGAGVTLACELLPKESRGLGTTFIAVIGVLGASLAVLIAKLTDWRTAYIFGGAIGIGLLLLRVNVRESALYEKLMREAPDEARGHVWQLVRRPDVLRRFVAVILVGAPIWGAIGLFVTFTPEFAKALGVIGAPTAGMAVLSFYVANSFGGFTCGMLCQLWQSRRKAVGAALALLAVGTVLYLTVPGGHGLGVYYALCALLGYAAGYWAMFAQIGAEQFGTNIRATAATSAPNFVRGLTIPITAGFHALMPRFGTLGAGGTVVGVLITFAAFALLSLRETFHQEMDYIEP